MKNLIFLLCISFLLNTAIAELPCCASPEAAADAAGSVYQLNAEWTDQHHKSRKLAELKGKPVLLTMGFTSCQHACPRLMSDLIAIEQALTDDEKKQVTMLFVSIDPKRDSPEKLAEFFDQYHVDQTRWLGFRGNDDAVLELSVAIGTRYRQLENNDFAHSNRITLLSPNGEIVYTQEGLGSDSTEMIAALRKLLIKPAHNHQP